MGETGETVTRVMTIEEQADAAHQMAALLRRIAGVEDEAKDRATLHAWHRRNEPYSLRGA